MRPAGLIVAAGISRDLTLRATLTRLDITSQVVFTRTTVGRVIPASVPMTVNGQQVVRLEFTTVFELIDLVQW